MKQPYLIIPMGGRSERFKDKGYNIYKTFLPIDNEYNNILDHIIKNFKFHKLNAIILIINKNIFSKIKKNLDKNKYKKIKIILINDHKKGPLFSIKLAISKLKKIIKPFDPIYISYCDIVWKWKNNYIDLKTLKTNENKVYIHEGFHPHLEVNSKSDFCKINRNKKITEMSEKKTFSLDYKKDSLAIGLYFLKSFDLLNQYFKFNTFKINNLKEYYLVSLINFLIKKNFSFDVQKVEHFCHLGIPEQYLDYIRWMNIFKKTRNENYIFSDSTLFLLANGKGQRLKNLIGNKYLLKVFGKKLYEYIIQHFGCVSNTIITNLENSYFLKKKSFKVNFIKKTNSMFDTIYAAKKLFLCKKNFFISSCDCIGYFDFLSLRQIIDNNNFDAIVFGFKNQYIQRKIESAHTQVKVVNYKVNKVYVKNRYNHKLFGQAGFYWIRDGKIFHEIENFRKFSKKKILGREIIFDDYISFLNNTKRASIGCILLDEYIHVGSEVELGEFKYWEKYFNQ